MLPCDVAHLGLKIIIRSSLKESKRVANRSRKHSGSNSWTSCQLPIYRKFGGHRTAMVVCFKMGKFLRTGRVPASVAFRLFHDYSESGRDEVRSGIATLGAVAASVQVMFAA